jgi:hypothetical protein
MYFDLEKIDKNLYFEFNIHGNNILRYNLDVNIFEISLEELSYYLTKDIYKEYHTKKNSNPNLKHFSEISFSLLIQTTPQIIEIEVDLNAFSQFPLNLCLEQSVFSINLNNTILLAIMQKEEIYSYYKTNEDSEFFALKKQNNNLWKHFPYFKHRIGKVFSKILNNAVYNLKFKFINEDLHKIHFENVINGITYDIEQIQNNINEILQEYHEIINQIRKYERLFDVDPKQDFGTFINKNLEMLKQDINLYFNYFHGNFKKIVKEDFIYCHKKWALILLKKFKYQDFIDNGLEDYLHKQVNEMVDQKRFLIERLYQIQSEAIIIWKK